MVGSHRTMWLFLYFGLWPTLLCNCTLGELGRNPATIAINKNIRVFWTLLLYLFRPGEKLLLLTLHRLVFIGMLPSHALLSACYFVKFLLEISYVGYLTLRRNLSAISFFFFLAITCPLNIWKFGGFAKFTHVKLLF